MNTIRGWLGKVCYGLYCHIITLADVKRRELSNNLAKQIINKKVNNCDFCNNSACGDDVFSVFYCTKVSSFLFVTLKYMLFFAGCSLGYIIRLSNFLWVWVWGPIWLQLISTTPSLTPKMLDSYSEKTPCKKKHATKVTELFGTSSTNFLEILANMNW